MTQTDVVKTGTGKTKTETKTTVDKTKTVNSNQKYTNLYQMLNGKVTLGLPHKRTLLQCIL